MKRKVLLASGNTFFDQFFREKLSDTYDIYDINQYSAESLLERIIEQDINILIIGEELPASNVLEETLKDMLMTVKKLTIVIYSKGEKEKGDEFFNAMLNIGIQRFIYGDKINKQAIISAIDDEVTPEVFIQWRPNKFRIISDDVEKKYDLKGTPNVQQIIDLLIQSQNKEELTQLFEKLSSILDEDKVESTFKELPAKTKKSIIQAIIENPLTLKKQDRVLKKQLLSQDHEAGIKHAEEVGAFEENELESSMYTTEMLINIINNMSDEEKKDLGLIKIEEVERKIEVEKVKEVVKVVEVVKEIPTTTDKVNILLLSNCSTGKTTLSMALAECMAKKFKKKVALVSIDNKNDIEIIFNIQSEGELQKSLNKIENDILLYPDELRAGCYQGNSYDVYCGAINSIESHNVDKLIKHLNILYDVVIIDSGNDYDIQKELSKTVTTKKIIVINQDICCIENIQTRFTIPQYNSNECILVINQYIEIKGFKRVLEEYEMFDDMSKIFYVPHVLTNLEFRMNGISSYGMNDQEFNGSIEEICSSYIPNNKKKKKFLWFT